MQSVTVEGTLKNTQRYGYSGQPIPALPDIEHAIVAAR